MQERQQAAAMVQGTPGKAQRGPVHAREATGSSNVSRRSRQGPERRTSACKRGNRQQQWISVYPVEDDTGTKRFDKLESKLCQQE